jgi:hypothetical protein
MFLKKIIDEVVTCCKYPNLYATKDDIVLALQRKFEDKECIVWDTEDVLCRAKEIGIKITKRQARIILSKTIHNHDASLGIRWDSFDDYIIDCK